ncbi:hypothetical protein [Cupriavidus necator]|uniref:hypothetical protein n=1 Tax=Cupriavidus necator TaxID=106590 RepID=UPI003AF3F467
MAAASAGGISCGSANNAAAGGDRPCKNCKASTMSMTGMAPPSSTRGNFPIGTADSASFMPLTRVFQRSQPHRKRTAMAPLPGRRGPC